MDPIDLHSKEADMDLLRAEFLADLDEANHLNVTDYEARFLESNLSRTSFSPAQREVVDNMRKKYEHKL